MTTRLSSSLLPTHWQREKIDLMARNAALRVRDILSIVEKINCSNDIKKLRRDELEPLCAEIRSFLVENIAKTGGHLASNLGTVELTVALHRVYDSSVDRLVFDVGHQSYTHKIITGRRDRFSTLRQYGGLSGFPKPYESADDAFCMGHASNSVSVALGMARARTLTGGKYDVAAIIGDGALTGGLASEGLSDAASSGEPLLIILNDNKMSISRSVGGTAKTLQDLRTRPAYLGFKRWYRATFGRLPALYRFNHRIKESLKSRLIPSNMFSEIGLYYLGPVDGHDVHTLETVIRWARDMRIPVLLHVVTQKGRGCRYAEQQPEKYHGIGTFDPLTGEVLDNKVGFSDMFGQYLCDLAEEDESIAAITAAMCDGTGIASFAERFPKRFFDVGIAEGHAVSMASGMAKQGLTPVFAVYSSFLQRAYDMLIEDAALQDLHVVFAVDRSGLVGNDGETHHGIFDVSYLCSVPNMTVFCPASFLELRDMLRLAVYAVNGPVAVRYPRGGQGEYTESCTQPEVVLKEGKDVTVVCYGTMINQALAAARLLEQKNISAEIIKLGVIKPNNFAQILTSVKKTARLIVAEDVCSSGCVGERIVAAAAQGGVEIGRTMLLNLGDGIVAQGRVEELLRDRGLDAAGIAKAAEKICTENG